MEGLAWSHTSVHRHTRGEDRGWKSPRDRIPRKTPPGKDRLRLGGPLRGEQGAGIRAADKIQGATYIGFPDTQQVFSVSVCKYCVDKCRRLEKGDKARGIESLCFMA